MSIPKSVSVVLRALWLAAATSATAAFALEPGGYSIGLQDRQGDVHVLGTLRLEALSDARFSYRVDWEDSAFENHFLSMRPFKCVPHPAQLVCHLAYPYELRRVISDDDLVDLEYDLLFLHKTPQEYGINAWNGLYFKLSPADDGLVGELRETDLNVLQAPPEDGDLRPIDPDGLYDASEKHWPRRVVIARQNPERGVSQ